jgi:Nucleotidyltransferase/DNA polymerase involved in DNA repair
MPSISPSKPTSNYPWPIGAQRYALVDCNSFYAACERVFRPELAQQPVAVLSNNDGCIIARSREVKELGFPMGGPYHHHKAALERAGVRVFSSNYALYGDLSKRVMDTLRSLTPDVEVYSIDESFVNLTGVDHRHSLEAWARHLRRAVWRATGVPVSIGVAPSKTLAKLANRLAKRHPGYEGVAVLDTPEQLGEILARTPVTDLWGVAKGWGARLELEGIHTALEYAHADEKAILKKLT